MSQSPNIRHAFSWKLAERLFAQVGQFVVQIILARKLSPDLFGTLAITTTIANLAALFVQSGISTAIVRKETLTNDDVKTAITLSFSFSAVLYLAVFLFSPMVEQFYDFAGLSSYLRWTALILFPGAATAVFTGVLEREMNFKALFYRSIFSVAVSGIVGIVMAYNGMGIWALIAQLLINQLLTAAILWISCGWKLQFGISKASFRSIYSFSSKIVVLSLLSQVCSSVRALVIGKKYDADSLAYFDKGNTYSYYLYTLIDSSISRVLLPVLAKKQDDMDGLKGMLRRAISLNAFVSCPVLVGFAVVAKPFISLVLTDAWAACEVYFTIFAAVRIFMIMRGLLTQAFYAVGNSGFVLKLQIVDTIATVAVLLLTIPIGVEAIAIGMIVTEVFCYAYLATGARKTVHYRFREQLWDVAKPILASLGMYAVAWPLHYWIASPFVLLIAQVLVGGLAYVGLSVLLRNGDLRFLWNQLRRENGVG